MPTYSFNSLFDGKKRPTEYGDVSIEYETIHPGTMAERERPVLARGYIYPLHGTSGRKSAPEPSSGFRIAMTKSVPKKALQVSARNTGRTDMDKGHIFALELGGPDVPANICPQFSQLQRNGEWRKMEVDAYAIAEACDNLVFMTLGVVYGTAQTVSRSLVPKGFLVELHEETSGGRTLIKSYQILNSQDHTDDMMALRKDPAHDPTDESMTVVYGDAQPGSPFDRPALGVSIGGRPMVQQALGRLSAASSSISRANDLSGGSAMDVD